jgi:hypothetical protein
MVSNKEIGSKLPMIASLVSFMVFNRQITGDRVERTTDLLSLLCMQMTESESSTGIRVLVRYVAYSTGPASPQRPLHPLSDDRRRTKKTNSNIPHLPLLTWPLLSVLQSPDKTTMSKGTDIESSSGAHTVSLFGSQVLQCHEAPDVTTSLEPQAPPVPDVVVDFRLRNGLCHACGARVYQIQESGRVAPLTIPGVANEGRCLHCYPDKEEIEERPQKRRRRSEDEHSFSNAAPIIKAEPLEDHDDDDDDDDDATNSGTCAFRHNDHVWDEHHFGNRKETHAVALAEKHDDSDVGKEITIHDAEGKHHVGRVMKGSARRGWGLFRCIFKKGPWKHKESVYEGEFRNGMFEGEGTLDDVVKGFVYIGTFRRGVANGYGACTWGQGWNYKGEWVNDRREGRGILSEGVEGGEVYDGEWKNDQWHGQGELRFNGGGCYIGEFRNHKIEGRGRVSSNHKLSIWFPRHN